MPATLPPASATPWLTAPLVSMGMDMKRLRNTVGDRLGKRIKGSGGLSLQCRQHHFYNGTAFQTTLVYLEPIPEQACV